MSLRDVDGGVECERDWVGLMVHVYEATRLAQLSEVCQSPYCRLNLQPCSHNVQLDPKLGKGSASHRKAKRKSRTDIARHVLGSLATSSRDELSLAKVKKERQLRDRSVLPYPALSDRLTGEPTRISTRVSKTNCFSDDFSSRDICDSGLTNVGCEERMSAARAEPSECAMMETRPLKPGLRAEKRR